MDSGLPLETLADQGAAVFYIAVLLFLGIAALVSLLAWFYSRPRTALPGVSPWHLGTTDFFAFILSLFGWMLVMGMVANILSPRDEYGARMDLSMGATLLVGFCMQAGFVAVFWFFRAYFRTAEERPLNLAWLTWRRATLVAVFGLLAALPVVYLSSFVWISGFGIARHFGFDIELVPQTPVEMFAEAEALWQVVALGALAVIVAPMAEEYVFRAGVYRFLRGHLSILPAVFANGLVFGLIHFNLQSFLPLAIFGALLCLAYEWTGSLRVPIVMHALFNLNTIIILKLSDL